jgi:hypothetical protein
VLNEEEFVKLAEGIRLFNEGEFFECHEFFEELWQIAETEELRAEFLFLVRIAAACVHLTNTNFSSLFLLQLALKQLNSGLQLNVIQDNNVQQSLTNLTNKLESCPREELPTIAQNLEFKLAASQLN